MPLYRKLHGESICYRIDEVPDNGLKMNEAEAWAKEAGLTEEDIDNAIKSVRRKILRFFTDSWHPSVNKDYAEF